MNSEHKQAILNCLGTSQISPHTKHSQLTYINIFYQML